MASAKSPWNGVSWPLAAGVLSLALSAVKLASHSTINTDGILYLETAQLFVEQGLRAAFHQFDWSFFPILIGLVHKGFGVGYEHAALGLNALLLALLSAGFVTLFRDLSSGNGRPWIAAAVILLSPELNDYRTYIIRDIGYWCLSLWAVLHFLRYSVLPNAFNALAWQTCIAGAMAFRIEAVALAALLPLACLAGPKPSRCWLGANSLFLLGLLLAGVAWAAGVLALDSAGRLEQLRDFLSLHYLSANFAEHAEAAARHVQAFYAPADAGLLLTGGALFLFLAKTAMSLGWAYGPLLGWGLWKQGWRLAPGRVWYACAIVALPLALFAINDLFLSERYMGLLAILLSLSVALALEALLYPERRQRPITHVATGVALAGLVLLLDALIRTGPSKGYIREAGDWLHGRISESAMLCSEDVALPYYAGLGRATAGCPALDRLARGESADNRFYAVKLKTKDRDKRQKLENLLAARADLETAAEFHNRAGDGILLLKGKATGSSFGR